MESVKVNVSVIITTKNRESLLLQALESVYKQTVRVDEIIVIDDGSCRPTNLLGDVKYIHNKISLGTAAARNLGMSLAKGDILFFLDDDDIWLSGHVASHCNIFCENENIGLCVSMKNIFFSDDKKILRTTGPVKQKNIFSNNFIGGPSSVSIRKKFAVGLGGFQPLLKAMEDYEYWIRFCLKYSSDSIAILNVPTIMYRVSANKNSNVSHHVSNHINAANYICKEYINRCNREDYEKLALYLDFTVAKTIHRISYYKMILFLFNCKKIDRRFLKLLIPYKILNLFGIYSS